MIDKGKYRHSKIDVMQTFVYTVWVITFMWLMLGARYQSFLHPKFWPLILLGAVLTTFFALSSLIPMPKEIHRHGTSSWLSGMFFGLPLLFLLTASGETLGSYAFSKRSHTIVEDSLKLAQALENQTSHASVSKKNKKRPYAKSNDTKQSLGKKRKKARNQKAAVRPETAEKTIKEAKSVKISPSATTKTVNTGSSKEKNNKTSPPAKKTRPSRKSASNPYAAKKLLAERLPTPENPLASADIDSAIPLSGYKSPESVKLFSRLYNAPNRLERYEGMNFSAAGEVFSNKDTPKGYFLFYRWFISCCLADATPVGIIVRNTGSNLPLNASWVHIDGILKIQNIGGNQVAYLEAKEVVDIPTPPAGKRYLTY